MTGLTVQTALRNNDMLLAPLDVKFRVPYASGSEGLIATSEVSDVSGPAVRHREMSCCVITFLIPPVSDGSFEQGIHCCVPDVWTVAPQHADVSVIRAAC